jgi:hypothetical protein
MPNRALYDYEIKKFVEKLKIPYFRGVFMRDMLPNKVRKNECAVVNLDSFKQKGSHWVSFIKRGNLVDYYDSFGNLKPPQELVDYLGRNVNIVYNRERFQKFNSINCGHLCIRFLYKNGCR